MRLIQVLVIRVNANIGSSSVRVITLNSEKSIPVYRPANVQY